MTPQTKQQLILRIAGINLENYRLYGISFHAAAASGKGGQAVNTTNSKAILHFDYWAAWPLLEVMSEGEQGEYFQRFQDQKAVTVEGIVQFSSQEERSWHQNRTHCLEKLKSFLLQSLKEHVLRDIRPPRKVIKKMAQQRRKEKSQRTQKKTLRSGVRLEE